MKVFSIIHNPCFVKALSLMLKVKNDSILEQQQLKKCKKKGLAASCGSPKVAAYYAQMTFIISLYALFKC